MTEFARENLENPRSGELLPACLPLLPGRVANLGLAKGVLKEMAAVYRATRSGRLDAQIAARLTYILGTMGKLWEVAELERRVAALETRKETSHGN